MGSLTLILALALPLPVHGTVYFREQFLDGAKWKERWVVSQHKSNYGKFRLTAGNVYGDREADKGLQTTENLKFYAISSRFKPFSNKGKTLVIQYTVKHEQKIDCGGGYVKLFPSNLNQKNMSGESLYYIMFGPDICGSDTKKVHIILNYKNKVYPVKKQIRCKVDGFTHLYTLVLKSDHTYKVKIDNKEVISGILEDDWDFLPPRRINDPAVKKPENWDDEAEIDDPEDTKPEGVNYSGPEDLNLLKIFGDCGMTRIKPDVVEEPTRDGDPATPSGFKIINLIVLCYRVSMPPSEESRCLLMACQNKAIGKRDWDIDEYIVDNSAEKPKDWDDAAQGTWQPPLLKNPLYRGEWRPRKIPNPNYKGVWLHPQVTNPEYVPDPNLYVYENISVIGLDLWQVRSGTIFDNFLITDDENHAKEFGDETWGKTKEPEQTMSEKETKKEKKGKQRKTRKMPKKKSPQKNKSERIVAQKEEL